MANLPLTEFAVPDYPDDIFIIGEQERADITTLENAVAALEETTEGIPTGTYPELTAGSILTDKYDIDTTPYLYRAMPYVSKRLEDVIVGGSVVWNQLCNATSVTITSGHKYYMKKGGTETVGASDGTALTGLTVGTDIVRDLTQMLGSTIADYINSLGSTDGVAFLKRYFITIGVYDSYDTGTIKSVEATAHITRGVNAWDEEWELGTFSWTTGEPASTTVSFRSKNFVRVIGGVQYYFCAPVGSTSYIRLAYYDADKNFVGASSWQLGMANISIPNQCAYLKFAVAREGYGGATYKNDICINISGPTINGKYFPYEEHTYPLGDVVLRGIPKLVNNELVYDGDIYKYDGSVTRKYGVVDLGTLAYSLWNSNENRDVFAFPNVQLDDLKSATTNTEVIDAICPKFIATSYSSTWKIGEMSYISAPTQRIAFIVPHGQYADASVFKTAMSGTYLLYPLATTTTETTTPFEQYQVCETGGTEEYITTNDVPVGHDTKYFTDVIGNIEDIPAPPTTNGTYTLQVTVSASGNTYAWV